MKNRLRYFMKIIGTGFISLVILCGIFTCYCFVPIHIENPLGNTDYVWPANSVWIKMTEGISWGRYDEWGFNNQEVIGNPTVLVLGSSHMEATNVMQKDNACQVLQGKLTDDYLVYNMGISGHHFAKVLQYLPRSIEVFEKAPKIIAVETSSLELSEETVQRIFEGNIDYTPSHDNGIIAVLQKLPFLRTLYYQLEQGLVDVLIPIKDDQTDLVVEEVDDGSRISNYEPIMAYLKELEEKYGTEIVIFYHPTGELTENGSVMFHKDPERDLFSHWCEDSEIDFLDLTEAFTTLYNEEHQMPHGFVTGEIGKGHLNKHGHRVIAEQLYEVIQTYLGE